MVETHLTASKPELYERLIDRLGLALDAARTSRHLRNEAPAELELKGLSRAEFDWLSAYLQASGALAQPASPRLGQERAGQVIWLKDRRRRPRQSGAQAMPFE
jgi:hypothetical protein